MGISDHKKFFESDTFILIDAIFIDSKWRIDAENYFKIRYIHLPLRRIDFILILSIFIITFCIVIVKCRWYN